MLASPESQPMGQLVLEQKDSPSHPILDLTVANVTWSNL